jgi:Glucose / Sorbosone dehydrogenase
MQRVLNRATNTAVCRSAVAALGTAICLAFPLARPYAGIAASQPADIALEISDFATLPVTGLPAGTGNNAGSLARINVMREEPAAAGRLFVNDLTGPLYILDRRTKQATTYLNFNGRGDRAGLFDKLTTEAGLASGFISFEFDPDYASNGRFYTIHLEELALPGERRPDNSSVPRLDVSSYLPTPPISPPGSVDHEGVLIEWTDANIANATFEGKARELLRISLNSRIHPLGDLTFNPVARPGDADWRVMYVACGDGGSGDQRTSIRSNPQRLDTVVGKILRIIPDLAAHSSESIVSDNGRYRIPKDNPFVAVAGAHPEIWAYGLRNPHRLSWDVDTVKGSRPHLIAAIIGWRTWETAAIVHKGANYGFPLREGGQLLNGEQISSELPQPDELPVLVNDSATNGVVGPTYPVLRYSHGQTGGDAIAGGFVYRGTKIPQLTGKYVFGDITTGRVWYAAVRDMLAADDGNARTLAEIHELHLWWNDPSDSPDRGAQLYRTMAPVVTAGYHARGGKDPDLPGSASVAGSGRVDLRFAVDRRGELYFLTKSDGMIRSVVAVRPMPLPY